MTLVNCSFVFVFETGIDEQLARHYAHLFIRDPLTLFHEHVDEDDEQFTDHFEVRCILGTVSAATQRLHGVPSLLTHQLVKCLGTVLLFKKLFNEYKLPCSCPVQ